jgi:hypothetical protein
LEPQTGPDQDGRRRWLLLGGFAGVALLLIAVLVFVTSRSSSKDQATGGAGEVFLEPTASLGPDPFTAPVGTDQPSPSGPPSTSAPGTTSPTSARATTSSAAPQAPRLSGDTVGLYGGTLSKTNCDKSLLVNFLQQSADKAAAWSSVHAIKPSDIASYVARLTPVMLANDTQVTNNGFGGGQATPRQSVLEAGSAVLIDDHGVPRVKCYCGNPLKEPIDTATTPRYTGNPWPTFRPENVKVVTPSVNVIRDFTLKGASAGQLITRPSGTDGALDKAVTTTSTTTSASTTSASTTTATPTTAPTASVPRDGLQAWLSGDRGVVATGGKVSRWTDQSGTGHDATQPDPNAQPTLQAAALKGRPALHFDGTDDVLTVGIDINPAKTPNLTIVAVFSSDTTATSPHRKLYSHDDGGFDRTVGLDDRARTNYSIFAGTGVVDYFTLSANTVYQTTDIWTSTQFIGRVNGRNTVSVAVGNGAGRPTMQIGGNPGFGEYWMGGIAEFLVYSRALTAAEQSQVESYLAAKYQ